MYVYVGKRWRANNNQARHVKGKRKKRKKKIMPNRGLEPLLSPSPGMQSVLDPVEPPRLDSKLKVLIAAYIVPAHVC